MKIEEIKMDIFSIVDGYVDNDEEGAKCFSGRLDARPPYQRNFVYNEDQRRAVIDSVMKGYPLNTMYWAMNGADYEIIDGQQRTLSICQYVNGDFAYNNKYYQNLTDDERKKFNNYELTIYLCDGTESEKLEWFKIINTQGERLNEQELRNAVYHGSWLNDAKKKFSARNCPAEVLGRDYLTGSAIRQDYLETALKWVSDKEGMSIEEYMAKHQHDANAGVLWAYYSSVIEWVKQLFPPKFYRREMKGVEWGLLYNKYGTQYPDAEELERTVKRLMADDDVTRKKGIYAYVIDGDERNLNIRAFTEQMKREAYERQEGICPRCALEGNNKKWDISEMDGDHIVEFKYGGHTISDNCQMLCIRHNRGDKTWKLRKTNTERCSSKKERDSTNGQ